jgi:hypothetical protein
MNHALMRALRPMRLLAAPLLLLCVPGPIPPLLCAEEKVEPRFDSRKWKEVSSISNARERSADYIPENETADRWTEMVSIQISFAADKKKSLEDLTKLQETRLRNICTGTVTWNIISRGDTDLLYEWKLEKDHLRPNEQRIVRLIRGENGIHILRYATRKVPMPDAQRARWIELLKAAKVVGTKK